MRKWRIEDSEELYNITGWGTSYFGINDKGHVVVTPRKDGVSVDLKELVDELQLRDVASPMLIRFPDISMILRRSLMTRTLSIISTPDGLMRPGTILINIYSRPYTKRSLIQKMWEKPSSTMA